MGAVPDLRVRGRTFSGATSGSQPSHDARATLALQGELDLETAPQFRERLAEVEQGAATVVIDLRDVTFMDSCGIGELVGANQRAHRDGRRLIVVKGHDTPIDTVLHMAAMDKTIETTTESP